METDVDGAARQDALGVTHLLICGAAAAVKTARCLQLRGITFLEKRPSLVGGKVAGELADAVDEAQMFIIGLQARRADSGG